MNSFTRTAILSRGKTIFLYSTANVPYFIKILSDTWHAVIGGKMQLLWVMAEQIGERSIRLHSFYH